MRLVDVDALREEITSKYCAECGADENCDKGHVANPKAIVICETKTALDCLDAAPTVEVEHVQHGKWEIFSVHENETLFNCSICNNKEKMKNTFPGRPEKHVGSYIQYCSGCGARMDGGTKDGAY